ncbi:metallophosphoesterase [bacterium]|nr:metallophosphoesterase [bacterium]
MAIFAIILIIIMSLVQFYVYKRVKSLLKTKASLMIFRGVNIFLWIGLVLSRVVRGGDKSFFSSFFEIIGMQTIAIVFMMATILFFADLIIFFVWILKRFKVKIVEKLYSNSNFSYKIRFLASILGIIFIIIGHIQGFSNPDIEYYTVKSKNLPKEFDNIKIALLTDLHVGEGTIYEDWLEAQIDRVIALKPDMVIFSGDIFEKWADIDKSVSILKKLQPKMGVFAVRGNHDTPRLNKNDLTGKILSKAAIPLLENRTIELQNGFIIAGVNDLTMAKRDGNAEEFLEKTLKNRVNGFTTLLSHSPILVEEISKKYNVDLMLSGHTHNGQIWPFNYIVKLLYPYINGLYKIGDMSIVVSRGAAVWGPRVRLWKKGEISLITLQSE